MKLEKILLGDDNLAFAKKAMPSLPGSQIDFTDSPEEVIRLAKQDDA